MARNFFKIFTENKPVRGLRKKYNIPGVNWLNGYFFLFRSSFFSTTRPLASSAATAYYRPAPSRTDSIPEREIYNFFAGMSKEQVFDKGIRQKSTERVNSFIVCSAFCPGPPNRDPMDSKKQLRVYTSGRTMARHVWCVDKKSVFVFKIPPIING